jgi:ribosomal protein S18 acetylase RimI-like enzyme
MEQPVIRTYLEMRARPEAASLPVPEGAHLERLLQCPVELYRQLYAEVGRQWSWFDRLWWSDEELAAHLGRPEVAVRVLHLNGAPAGYYELVSHPDDRSAEIGYFGLMPHAIGRGLGRWLLTLAIQEAWDRAPDRVWLHTCTLDHPAALPNYQKAGFVVTKTEQVGLPAAPS